MFKTNTSNNLKYFFLKRELYYHKIQYSKVLKHDISAAVFGVVLGAFAVYLSLNTLGSGSPDLSDLSVCLWYTFIGVKSVFLITDLIKIRLNLFNFILFLIYFVFFNILI